MLVFALSPPQLHAKNCEITVPAQVTKVSFSNNHTIKSDSGETFVAPHYTHPLNGEKKSRPTAYTKFTSPTVEMEFEIQMSIPENEACTVKVKAKGTDDVDLPEKTFTLKNGKNTLTYTPTAASKFPDKIRFYGPGIGTFKFDWQISIDGGEFGNFDTTNHRIYLTVATPTCAQGNRETLFYYACNKPNENAGTVGKDVTHLIWQDFVPKAMQRIDSSSGALTEPLMTFWPSGSVVKDGTGDCSDWAEFFCDVLGVHGYPSQNIDIDGSKVIFDDNNEHDASGWIVAGNSKSITGGTINGGQGAGTNTKKWLDHTISKAFDEYYDAGYGVGEAKSKAEYEDEAVAWYHYSYVTVLSMEEQHVFQDRVKKSENKLTYTVAP